MGNLETIMKKEEAKQSLSKNVIFLNELAVLWGINF